MRLNSRPDYIPALKYDWLTFLFDPLLQCTLRDKTFKRRLVKQSCIEEGNRVLDVGCGTATLTLLAKVDQPNADVVGLDGDPKILKIARAKATKAKLKIALDLGMSFELPYADNSFDRVLSSLLFHHLTRQNKIRTLQEILRVLRPGGQLHVADWGKPQNILMRLAFYQNQLFDGFKTTTDNVKGLLPILFAECGFEKVEEPVRYATICGTLSLYQARKPNPGTCDA